MEPNCFPEHTNTAYVSEAAVRHNYKVFREHCGPTVGICPAVKANAYGHEVSIVAPALARAGAKMFCVANILEARELTPLVPGAAILVFSPVQIGVTGKELLLEAIEAGYSLTVADMPGADLLLQAVKRASKNAAVQIKVDTGMGRMGARPQEALELVRFVSGQAGLVLEGLYTHFASADEAEAAFTHEQLACFDDFLAAARGIKSAPLSIHAANSAAALRFGESHFDMVRPGISIYGYHPSKALSDLEPVKQLRPALRLESRLVLIKDLPKGHSCGYGRTFTASKPTRVGIVPIGYGDGYDRGYSNRAVMHVAGQKAPVIGRVSMDQTILDLTAVPQAQPGDTVTVISEKRNEPNSVEALAELADTIPHEVTCRLGRRIARVGLKDF